MEALRLAPASQFDRVRSAAKRAQASAEETIRNGWVWFFAYPIGANNEFKVPLEFVLLPDGACHGDIMGANASGRWETDCTRRQDSGVLRVRQAFSSGEPSIYEFAGEGKARSGHIRIGQMAIDSNAEQIVWTDAIDNNDAILGPIQEYIEQGAYTQALAHNRLSLLRILPSGRSRQFGALH
jgi:hypothetical protein